MRRHRVPTTSGRGSVLDPSGDSFTRAPRQLLSPLPPPHGSPVIGEGKKVFFGNGLNHTLRLFLYFTDWHDGGNGASLPQPGQPND